MAFLVKKVLKGVSSRWDEGSPRSRVKAQPLPMCPPTPDISDLTPEEIAILKDVFRRQEEFERQESERVKNISSNIEKLEETVHRETTHKGQPQTVDLGLCRICHKTRFSETHGLGRLCAGCHMRVCSNCGEFSHPKSETKRSKNVRGRWRCHMCLMKRDAICSTGSWYHGSSVEEGPDQVISILRSSISMDHDSDEANDTHKKFDRRGRLSLENRTDSELYTGESSYRDKLSVPHERPRRRSLPLSHVVKEVSQEEADDNGCSCQQNRRMLRHKRQLRRMRRRPMQESRTLEDLPAVSSEGSQDEIENVESVLGNEQTDRNSRVRKRRPSRVSLSDRGRSISVAKAAASPSGSSSDVSYATKESSVSDGACSPTLISKIKRQNAVYCSSSSSILSDAKHSDTQGGTTSPRNSSSRSPVHVARERRSTNERTELLNRRATLQKCELIGPFEDQKMKRFGALKSHNPHDVILHRDVTDTSHRTYGLGMRVVGGKECDTGGLGAFVVMVTKGGPADVQGGIKTGDQITEWNGISLTNVTFEETRDILGQSGNVVQLKVVHKHIGKRLSEDMEASRVPRMESADSALCPIQVTYLPPDSLPIRPRRRMLPKTPIEMKKETRRITGRILTRIHYLTATERLEITILRAEELSIPDAQQKTPNPLVLVHMLPDRKLLSPKVTSVQKSTRYPEWNKTFYFHNISEIDLLKKSIEITAWSQVEKEDIFLGEVLLDLHDANLEFEPQWYGLEDHDDNSSPLPDRKRPDPEIPETIIEVPKNGLSPSTSPNMMHRSLPVTPSDHGSTRSLFRRSPSADRKSPCLTPPRSPTNQGSFDAGTDNRNSFTKKVRRKMSNAVSKMSSSLSVSDKRDSCFSDDTSPGEVGRSRSFGDESRDLSPNRPRSRKTSGCKPANPDLLAPPRPLSRTNSQSSFYENESDPEDDIYADLPPTPETQTADGQTLPPVLGPAQVSPQASSDNSPCGDIRLGFMVSKGQLEVDVVCARGVTRTDTQLPSDIYAKTYLVEGKKILQKKKTQVIKGGNELLFRRMIKYSACNVHGRYMKINIWERVKGFDKKKQCLGETVVRLDSLDLSKHTLGWYKLFKMNSTDLGSNESLYHW